MPIPHMMNIICGIGKILLRMSLLIILTRSLFSVEFFKLTNIEKFGVSGFTWHELYRKSAWVFADYVDRLKYVLAGVWELLKY